MSAADRIDAACRLLDKHGLGETTPRQREEADSHSLVALAEGLDELVKTVKDDHIGRQADVGPWPENVTARILTAYGRRFDDPRATVDVHDYRSGAYDYSQGRCICGDKSPEQVASFRNEKVLPWVRGHADECMAMPRPVVVGG